MAAKMDAGMIVITLAIGLAAGALAGALINAITTRLPADLEPIGPPVCYSCGTVSLPSGLIPFRPVSCPDCAESQGWHKLATEAAAVALTTASLLIHGLTTIGAITAALCLILLMILRIDWQHHLIFVVTIVPSIIFVLAVNTMRSQQALISSVIAGVGAGMLFGLFFLLAILIYRQQALGFGDILLATLLGAMAGVERVVPAIFLGMVLAAAGGLFLILIGQRGRHDYIPYGAYLCAGTMIVLLLPR